ncbi:glycosyltransferase family A protein [Morganella morganii]|uniref:glycosyltransferase family A protein n=1 Tax=Morganella morganii TaxID=582 RepID=UPI000949A79C|nr:glycosyltransferase family 2 protein [Morganella morganii]ELB1852171.1 glycosyltransferase family 2 protein [Morganella morganii]MBT0491519.1 glycosyltransferase family 2 protein [Morganella morganii subsp. morganii]MBT0495029.1 glycosyltransferase family 2 protein [Morganella morganii subsp. morganii]QWL93236.1 glycosyltransferase family 2 protein [Morganella morganii subsp. morganii]QWM07725.1 glycosyltransferase family 2 protein [Morganella morganii subsp. morganii]
MRKYSVIIPCFNSEHYLSDILTFISHTHMTRSDIEFIIINDGSTDKTDDILSSEQGFLYISQPNRGVSASRNLGISLSSGEYILFLDADDYFSENIFSLLDSHIEKNTDSDIYTFNYSINKTSMNKKMHTATIMSSHTVMHLFLHQKLHLCICSICIKHSFILENKIQFPTEYSFGEDIFFILQSIIHSKNKVYYIPDILFNYNLSQSGTVQSVVTKNKINVISLYNSLFQFDSKISKKTLSDLIYFQQRTFFYLIKLSLKFNLENKETLDYLFNNKKILKKRINRLYPLIILFNIASPLLYKILNHRLLSRHTK